MKVSTMKWVSVGLIALLVVSSLFFPWYSTSAEMLGEKMSESMNFFDSLGAGWFFVLLSVVFELALLATCLFAISGHLKDVRDNFMSTGLLVVVAAAVQLLFYLIASGAVAGDAKEAVEMIEMMGGKARMGVTLWPFLNLVIAAGSFVCWTMYTKGSATISFADVQAAANDVRSFSQADIQAAMANARATATEVAAGVKDVASDVRQAVAGAASAAPVQAQPGGWFCPNCGNPCAPTNKFCQKCGTKKPE